MSEISDPNDVATLFAEQHLKAALSNALGNGEKKELVPSTQCYGCFADLSEEEQKAGTLYCPDSSEECRGYHQMEVRQGRRRHMPASLIYKQHQAESLASKGDQEVSS